MSEQRLCRTCQGDITDRHRLAVYCEDCAHERKRAQIKAAGRRFYDRATSFLREVLTVAGTCGYCKDDQLPPELLQFHHKDPARKRFTIGGQRLVARGDLVHEVRKCVALCPNCHAKVHKGLIDISNAPLLDPEVPE